MSKPLIASRFLNNTGRSSSIALMAGLSLCALSFTGCSDPSKYAQHEQGHGSANHHSQVAATPVEIKAPSGAYKIDRTHAILGFSVSHLGLSNYQPRFADYDVQLNLDTSDITNSSVAVTIKSESVTTGYDGNYVATHKDSPYDGWDEQLGNDPKFLNAEMYPEITFVSTSVAEAHGGALKVTGDLTLLGVTKPITLNARVVGSMASHPFTKKGALGFKASGSFKRSDFGMTYLLKPPLIGDEVTLIFDGEFHQQVGKPKAAE